MAKKYPKIIGESKKEKKPPLRRGCPDDFQIPPEALNPLLPYLKKEWVIWECACSKGNLSNRLKILGYNVIATDILIGQDFLTYEPENYDCIVTNPPYSLKDQFLERAYFLGKPFAFLLPITTLEGKRRQALFVQNGLEIILFNKRINFETPNGHGSSSWFATAWFTNGLKIGRQISWADLSSVPRELDLTHSPKRGNIGPHQREVLTPEELAEYLKIPLSAIYRNWKRWGGFKIVGKVRFIKENIDEYLQKIQQRRDQVLLPDHGQREVLQGRGIQNKKRSSDCRSRKKEFSNLPPSRHGLW